MKILKEVIRKNIRVMAVFAVMVAANATIFALYDIITEPMIYASPLALRAYKADDHPNTPRS